MFEVHREKRHLGGNVGATESPRELQAIEQPNTAILDADARSVQVTMAIANATLDHPPVQQRRSLIQETAGRTRGCAR